MKNLCSCNEKIREYSFFYDSYYCRKCGLWVESTCKHPNCQFCKDRPEKPYGEKEMQRLDKIYQET